MTDTKKIIKNILSDRISKNKFAYQTYEFKKYPRLTEEEELRENKEIKRRIKKGESLDGLTNKKW